MATLFAYEHPNFVDLNFSGCQIDLQHREVTLTENSKDLKLYIKSMTHHFHIRIIKRNQKNLRCILIQCDVNSADEFNPHTLPCY
jgi:hypothetical protein